MTDQNEQPQQEGLTAPNGTKLSKQNEIVIRCLMGGKTLTNVVAITCYGVGSLSSRVAELRKMGYRITDETNVDRFERSFKKYKMAMPSGDR